jgi:branched-chain amino acid transport system permease protein
MMTIISALGLNMLTGYCGQFSIGHAAFMAVGAFTGANLMVMGVNFWLALLASGVVAGVVGVFFGLPSGKVKGFYLVLSTLAAQFLISYIIISWFGGDVGVHPTPIKIGGIDFSFPERFYYITLVLLVLMTYLAKNIARTKAGRAFIAIRDNDIAAEAMGINVFGYKLLAFFIGCFYAGIAGCLWISYTQLAVMEPFSLFESVWYLGIIIVGGMGSIVGTYFGAIFIRGIKELTYIVSPMIGALFPSGSAIAEGITVSLPYFVFGLAVVLFILFEPRGLYHRWGIIKTSGRLWPWGYW